MFETDYEDFVIELFSEFPTSVSFFKVSDKLFMLAYVSKPYMRSIDLIEASSKWYIPAVIIDLLNKGILRNGVRAMVDYSKGKDL